MTFFSLFMNGIRKGASFMTDKDVVKVSTGLLILITVCGCSNAMRLSFSPVHLENREQQVEAYLQEFSSPAFNETKVGDAIYQVMMRLPPEALLTVMDRRRPVIFTEVYDAGTARFASSSEIIATPEDAPVFCAGMTIIKISTAMNQGPVSAIMGVIAHELAHRVLDHVRKGDVNCQAERDANRLIQTWGFADEFEAASQYFGRSTEGQGVASCQEE